MAYDVRDDRRRARLADALENHGKRVQLSVFECLLEEAQVERIVAVEEDSVRIYRLCGVCEPRVEVVGVGVRTEDPDVYVV